MERGSRAVSRRALLATARSLALASLAAPLAGRLAAAQRFLDDPFSLGVASGDPVPDGFVIWTRLAPDPIEGGGMGSETVPVRWEVARDERFLDVVRRGTALAAPERAHAVHVDVAGLEPDRWYCYRFVAGGAASPIGRARTFPSLGTPKDRFRLAAASCQHFGQGYFTAYRAMLEDDLDLVVHLGDYVYESDWGPKIRYHLPEPTTLDGYRNLHALYKTDPDLKAAHAAYPFVVTWDDHEVENDYASRFSANGDPPEIFLKRRAAAYQAYYEHMPLRASARPVGPDARLFTAHHFGSLATIAMLDERQYRSDQACPNGKLGGQVIENCPERVAEDRTMLGPEQERWLGRQLVSSPAAWRVIGQQLLMAQLDQKPGEGDAWWSDGWDGYPAARRRLLSFIADRRIPNVVVLGGDIHSFWVSDLKRDFADRAAPPIASEFVGTSITSQPEQYEVFARLLPENPHIRFFESRERGYLRCEVTPSLWRTDLRAVSTITEPTATARTLKSFAVESGKAGVLEGS